MKEIPRRQVLGQSARLVLGAVTAGTVGDLLAACGGGEKKINTVTSTATAPATATGTPKPIDTPKPTDTPTQTETVAPTDTAKPTDTPTVEPTKTPEPTPIATETPEIKKFPEISWEEEPFKSIKSELDEIQKVLPTYTGDALFKKDWIPFLETKLEKGDVADALDRIITLSYALLLKEDQIYNLPPDLIGQGGDLENKEHRDLREKVIEPLIAWIQQYVPEDTSVWKNAYQSILDKGGITFDPSVLQEPPFSQWLFEMGQKDPNGVHTFEIRMSQWQFAAKAYYNLANRVAYDCTRADWDDFYHYNATKFLPQLLAYAQQHKSLATVQYIKAAMQENGCTVPQD